MPLPPGWRFLTAEEASIERQAGNNDVVNTIIRDADKALANVVESGIDLTPEEANLASRAVGFVGRQVGKAAIPVLAGRGVGALTGMALGAPAAAPTAGTSSALGAIGGMVAGGVGTGLLQEYLLNKAAARNPQGWIANLQRRSAQDVRKHPYLSQIAQMGTAPIGGGGFGIGSRMQALAQGALQAGVDIPIQYSLTGKVDPIQVLLSGAGGAVTSKPSPRMRAIERQILPDSRFKEAFAPEIQNEIRPTTALNRGRLELEAREAGVDPMAVAQSRMPPHLREDWQPGFYIEAPIEQLAKLRNDPLAQEVVRLKKALAKTETTPEVPLDESDLNKLAMAGRNMPAIGDAIIRDKFMQLGGQKPPTGAVEAIQTSAQRLRAASEYNQRQLSQTETAQSRREAVERLANPELANKSAAESAEVIAGRPSEVKDVNKELSAFRSLEKQRDALVKLVEQSPDLTDQQEVRDLIYNLDRNILQRREDLIRRGLIKLTYGDVEAAPAKLPIDVKPPPLPGSEGSPTAAITGLLGKKKVAPVPESPSAVVAQIGKLGKGLTRAVLITPGERIPEGVTLPKGFVVTDTVQGKVIHNPNVVDAVTVKNLAQTDKLGSLLGHATETQPAGAREAVMIVDKSGAEVKGGAVTPETKAPEVAALSKQLEPAKGETIVAKPIEQALGERRKGIISGSPVEAWADKVIKDRRGSVNTLDPELLAAYSVKGLAHIERGALQFTDWSVKMLAEFGQTIRPYLNEIFARSKQMYQDKPDFVSHIGSTLREKLKLQSNQMVDGNSFLGRLKNLYGAENAELKSLLDAGLQKFLSKPRTMSEIENWINENSFKVKIASYGMEEKVSEARREYDRMTHAWYDSRDAAGLRRGIDIIGEIGENEPLPAYITKEEAAQVARIKERHPDWISKAKQYRRLREQVANESRDTFPRATSAYEGVSAFDTKEPMPEWTTSKEGRNVQRVDVVIPLNDTHKAWIDKHINIPSDAPNREQLVQEYKQKYDEREKSRLWQPDNLHENLPNTLGWAMIQYKTGPKGEKIAVVVETQSRWGQEVREAQKKGLKTRDVEPMASTPPNHPLLRDYNRLILKAAIKKAREEGADYIAIVDGKTAMMTEGHDLLPTISQEKGMRLNYDQILPRTAEQLTRAAGRKVVLGKHKNAFDRSGQLRKDLKFFKPDGSPDIDVVANLYPIKEAPVQFTATGALGITPKGPAIRAVNALSRGFRPGLKRIESDFGRIGYRFKKRYEQARVAARQLIEPYQDAINQMTRGLNKKDIDAIGDHLAARYYGEQLNPLTPNQARALAEHDEIQYLTGLKRSEPDTPLVNEYVNGELVQRPFKPKPNFFDQVPNRDFWKAVRRGTGEEYDHVKELFIDHQIKYGNVSPDKALEIWNSFTSHGKGLGPNPEFAQLRLPEGIGLPKELRMDWVNALRRKVTKQGLDIAFHRNFEADPELGPAMGYKTDGRGNQYELTDTRLGANDDVRAAIADYVGALDPDAQRFESWDRFFKSGLIQTLTQTWNYAQSPTVLGEWVRPRDAKGLVDGLAGALTRKAQIKAIQRGSVRAGRNVNPASAADVDDLLNKASDLVNAIDLVEPMEKIHRTFYDIVGETISKNRLKEGDAEFFNEVGPENWQSWDRNKLIDYTTARLVEKMAGGYSAEELPNWLLRGSGSRWKPFFSLARWSIGRANHWIDDVYKPAVRKGKLEPLIYSLAGGVLSVGMVNYLKEALTNRKPRELTWEEYLNMPADAKDTAYTLLSKANTAGYAGILGSVAFQVLAARKGERPYGFENPLIGGVAEIFERLGQFANAVARGDTTFDEGFPKLIKSIMIDRIQLARTFLEEKPDDGKREERIARRVGYLPPKPLEFGGSLTNPYGEAEAYRRDDSKALAELLTNKRLRGQPLRGPTTAIRSDRNYYRFIEDAQGVAAREAALERDRELTMRRRQTFSRARREMARD